MFRRIFVPVDGRAPARAAARLAAQMARAYRGEVRACFVVDRALLAGAPGATILRNRLRAELEADGHRALREVETICRRLRVPCRTALATGAVTDEIVKAARRARAQVMVVGTRGRGVVRSLLRGSLVATLVDRAPCPLLVLRASRGRRRRGAR